MDIRANKLECCEKTVVTVIMKDKATFVMTEM